MKAYHLIKALKGEYSWSDYIDFFRGNIRYWLYWNAKYFLTDNIIEQFEMRVKVMDRDCYNNGECKVCGCRTLNLQMCNKACEGHCYPRMMSRKQWRQFNSGNPFIDGDLVWYKLSDGFQLVKTTKNQYEFEDEMININL